MGGLRKACAIAVVVVAVAPAFAVDFDDPATPPLHFAVETLSDEFVTVALLDGGPETYYNLEAPPSDAALTTTTKLSLPASESWYVRVDLDRLVFSVTPELRTSGTGSGSGVSIGDEAVLRGGAGAPFVVYRLPVGQEYAQGLTFSVSVDDALAVPADEGIYGARLALYDDALDASDGAEPRSADVFGGERTLVVVTAGLEIDIESRTAVADVETAFEEFTKASAPGDPSGGGDPSADAVLGSVAVGVRDTAPGGRQATVYAARGGLPVTVDALVRSVSVTIRGDVTFGTFDLRTGTAGNACLPTGAPDGGVLALSPPAGETTVTDFATATLVHAEEAFGRRNLCVRLPEREPEEDPVRIPAGLYEATVSVTPPGNRDTVERVDIVGEIRRSGARVDLVHLTGSEHHDQWIVLVNHRRLPVGYEFVEFAPAPGVTVTLTPDAAAAQADGLSIIPPGSQVVLPVAATLAFSGPAADVLMTAATLFFNANENDIQVVTVQVNRRDGSTDTVVYAAQSALDAR